MNNQKRFVFFSAVAGNVLEYYDFTVYSVFLVIIGKNFFPATSEFIQTLSSLAVFAVGFIARPIGGIVFGYIGDRYGRKVSLICSMLGMTVPTFSIGLIPSFNEIGYFAPISLIILRLIQGLCISGEGAGSAIFVLEHYNKTKPGFVTSIVHASNITGTLLASLVGILIEKYLSHLDYSWRFAFLLGGIMGIVGFYLRLRVNETPIFQELSKRKQTLKSPFINVIKFSKPALIITFSVAAVTSSVVYLVKTYVNVFYSSVMHLDNTTSLIYLSYASTILMFVMPLSGYVSDIVGRDKLLKIASKIVFVLILPTLLLMSSTSQINHFLALTSLGTLAGLMSGVAYIYVISLFKPEERFSGVAFSYNFGIAVFGGTSPLISRWLAERFSFYAPALYIMFLIILLNLILKLFATEQETTNN